MGFWSRLLCAAIAFAPGSALAQDLGDSALRSAPEVSVGVLAHGVRRPFVGPPPAGFSIFEGEEERGTTDLQVVYRSAPIRAVFAPRLTARLELNTGGRTNFASVGAEWRRHVLNGRLYGQVGIGLTIHDGRRFTPDPFEPGLAPSEAARRYSLYARRTAFGSRVLFNPNLSLGVRLNETWAVEAALEHFSHKQVFSEQNPGIDNIGLRLVHAIGGR